MNLSTINSITESKYGFSVFDLDHNRGEGPKAGRSLIKQCELTIAVGSTAEAVAEKFAEIMTQNNCVMDRDIEYKAKSVHLRVGENGEIGRNPMIFIYGVPIYKGHFVDVKLEGMGTITYPKGHQTYEGCFKQAERFEGQKK